MPRRVTYHIQIIATFIFKKLVHKQLHQEIAWAGWVSTLKPF